MYCSTGCLMLQMHISICWKARGRLWPNHWVKPFHRPLNRKSYRNNPAVFKVWKHKGTGDASFRTANIKTATAAKTDNDSLSTVKRVHSVWPQFVWGSLLKEAERERKKRSWMNPRLIFWALGLRAARVIWLHQVYFV